MLNSDQNTARGIRHPAEGTLFHKLIFKWGQRIKYPGLTRQYKSLMQTDRSPLSELKALQQERLRKLLKHAKSHSPFHAERLKNIDVSNATLETLHEIPILTKSDLLTHDSSIQNLAYGGKHVKSETSGSSGDALLFLRNASWDTATRAAQMRGYTWHGVKPWEQSLYFWGFNFQFLPRLKTRILDFLVNRYRIFSFSPKELKKTRDYLKRCSYVEGYSSAIFTMARELERTGHRYPHVNMIKGTSEVIYPYYQDIIQKVFHQKMISEYGAAESGIIAFECPEGNMHIAMENVIVREKNQKIYVTNLFSFSFPVINYELGDYIKLNEEKLCPCGRAHLIIEEIQGRVGKKIIGKLHHYPSLTLYYVFKNITIQHGIQLAYYGYQDTPGALTIKIIGDGNQKTKYQKLIQDQCQNYFKDDLHVTVEFIESLNIQGGKTKDFESSLEEGTA
jgi:phenylacetate-CoA ligase